MTTFIYTSSIPAYKQMLNALSEVLRKAEAHANEKKIDHDAYLQARLYPDMFPLIRQVQIAVDFAKGAAARLSGTPMPSYPDTEKTFKELQELLNTVLGYIDTLDAKLFEGASDREIVLRPGTPKERKLNGSAYLRNYNLPQFFFHVTTAYAILRHNGIDIGKRDYMGEY